MVGRTNLIPVGQLEVVGYADVLEMGTPPRKVPPIFRFREDHSRFVFPPLLVIADYVANATVAGTQHWNSMIEEQQATALPEAQPALPYGVLWVDSELNTHYGSQLDEMARLRAMAKDKYREAKRALRVQEFDRAQSLARWAFGADERLWLALALQTAVDRLRGDEDGVAVLRSIAADLVPAEDFDQQVEQFIGQSRFYSNWSRRAHSKSQEGRAWYEYYGIIESHNCFGTFIAGLASPNPEQAVIRKQRLHALSYPYESRSVVAFLPTVPPEESNPIRDETARRRMTRIDREHSGVQVTDVHMEHAKGDDAVTAFKNVMLSSIQDAFFGNTPASAERLGETHA